MDKISKTQRSANMRAVRGKHTSPELAVRKAAHRLGLRFRLHHKDLPGKPDLVFSKWRTVVFVNGCFWHGHDGCRKAKLPSSNTKFWRTKLSGNVERDHRNYRKLTDLGWHVEVIWQCDIPDAAAAAAALDRIPSLGAGRRRKQSGPLPLAVRTIKHEAEHPSRDPRR
ncbi:very short patch repair endonuclease [Bradyrhizobium betae]|uniref:very short patch repair endonuclease n=1 Tax=Bradyrhizobium betae TaxID=244734 RepID=UPI003D671877